jgi:predicted RNA-binding Zn-ribbon protein involved in translation (DUF1610 family)
MSYYGVHSAEVDYMICPMCGDEAFAWLAEQFACPTCGRSEYVYPESEHEANEVDAPNVVAYQHSIDGPASIERKRKRSGSDEGKMRR